MPEAAFLEQVTQRLKEACPEVSVAEPSPIKGVVNFKVTRADTWALVFKTLKEELGFEFLDFLTAVDWKGPVGAQGFIQDPNPNPFLPEGATPSVTPEPPTPGFPYREKIELVAAVSNWNKWTRVVVRLELPREAAKAPTLINLWKTADWQEREAYDLLGVVFEGHPNLKKILTPDFIAGHPLRKDYVHVKDQYD
ncbi:MAG: NADH-quinone oxidoreductase subunit C [Elusimicrobia bacterium]|nr:NADH-quinone oxidoreductase subunit C [Elusimicrobiota bacterium]